MILPIIAYGSTVLRKESEEIDASYPELKELIANMFATMENANGIGLAAPQIGLGIRLFIIDSSPLAEDEENKTTVEAVRKIFINPEIMGEEGKEWKFNEGCLSIPEIREDVYRKPDIVISYYDENFQYHEDKFSGILARIIQHEYDHIEGTLFVDYLSTLKKRLLKRKLSEIAEGKISVDYKMKFPNLKKTR
jgi:peptide deformylase